MASHQHTFSPQIGSSHHPKVHAMVTAPDRGLGLPTLVLLFSSLFFTLTACDNATLPPDLEPEVPWSLLTGEIAYSRSPLFSGESRLVIVDASRRTVTEIARGSDFASRLTGFCPLAWAPDRSRIAFNASRESPRWRGIMSVDKNGRNPKVLFHSTPGVAAGTSSMSSPAWARDGRLAYTLTHNSNWTATEIWIDGQLFYDAGEHGWDLVETPPAWSPDGRHLVVAAQSQPFRSQLLQIALADGTVTQLFEALTPWRNGASLYTPVFSPDGAQIAFTNERPGGVAEIWIMNADGSAARRLTEGFGPAWAPDGSMILYRSRYGVLLLRSLADGVTYRLIEGFGGLESCPVWIGSPAARYQAERQAKGGPAQ
jgi:hypothetical protein